MFHTPRFERNADRWALFIILLSVVTRLMIVATGQLNLVQDEAQYWDWTRHIQFSYYSKGPLIAWIIGFWTFIFGDTELGVRFGALLGSGIAQTFLYLGISRLWKRPAVGLWALFIANSVPLFLASGILMTTDNPLVVCWGGALFALYAAACPDKLKLPPKAPYFWLGFFLAVGIWAKYMMLSFVPMALIFVLLLHRRGELPDNFWRPFFKAVLVGFVVGMLPILIWNIQNDFVGFKHVGTLAGVTGKTAKQFFRLKYFPEYLGGQIGLITPWWLVIMVLGAWSCLRRSFGLAARNIGLDRAQSTLLAVFFWPMWGFILVWSLHTRIEANWSACSYVAGILVAAFTVDALWRAQKGWFERNKKYLVTLALVTFGILLAAPVLPLPDHLNPTHRLKGWEDLGQQVEKLRLEEFKDADKVFIFSERYDITSALAFYVPGKPRTYSVWLDRRMNQYDIWPGPQEKVGWGAVYVRKGFTNRVELGVEKLFGSISEPIHFQTHFKGAPARKFTIFICRDYNGEWPRYDKGGF